MTNKIKIGKPHAQKQQCSSPSLQASRRCHTLAFFAAHLLLLGFMCFDTMAQYPYVTAPTPGNHMPNTQIGRMDSYYPTAPISPDYTSHGKSIHEKNMEIIENDINTYETKKYAAQIINNEYELYTQLDYQRGLFKYIKSNYNSAFNKLKDMLEGNAELNLKQAVYEVEHAFNNTFTFEEFDNAIKRYAEIVKLKLEQDKSDFSNSAINIAIAQVMADTITLKVKHKEEEITSYPLSYDFDDAWGENDWNNMFVSKLLFTGKGQCHSMPLLHLIVAEELGANAYLSLSPNHSFIKFQHGNTLYNLETTQGVLVTDQWIMASDYLSTEAIKNKVFLDTLNTKQVISNCLCDLASGYIKVFGYRDTSFIFACTDLSLKYYDKGNAIAHVIKNKSYLANISMMGQQLCIPKLEDALKVPAISKLWELESAEYQYLKTSGYKNIPKDKYDAWLQTARTDKK